MSKYKDIYKNLRRDPSLIQGTLVKLGKCGIQILKIPSRPRPESHPD